MAEVAEPPVERKPRKSVAFSDGATIVDSDGQVTESGEMHGRKNSAESHSADVVNDKAADETEEMFKDLSLKKKKKKSTKPKEGEDAEAPAADGDVDLSALKKKKKKKIPKADADDFEEKLAQAAGDKTETTEPTEEASVETGDMFKGTGIWEHNSNTPIKYDLLLNRFFTLLHSQHPDLASSGGKSYKIPPPQCLREGNKKTIFANISEICRRMKRTDEHVTQFLFAELGTSGSVDGSRRLVIKGRFQQKQEMSSGDTLPLF